MKDFNFLNYLQTLILLFFCSHVYSQEMASNELKLDQAKIEKVKKNRLIFTLYNEKKINLSEKIDFLDKSGQVVAIIEVLDIRSQKVLGKFIKRTVEFDHSKDYYLRKSNFVSEDNDKKYKIGIHLVYNLQSLTTIQKSQNQDIPVQMQGSSLGFEVSADYLLTLEHSVNLNLGFESIEMQKQSDYNVCSGQSTRDCYVKTKNIVGYVAGKIIIKESDPIDYWLGGGAKLKYSLNKESNAINQNDLLFFHSLVFQLGLDYRLVDFNYISAKLTYDYSLNTSQSVPQINQYGLSVGYIFQF